MKIFKLEHAKSVFHRKIDQLKVDEQEIMNIIFGMNKGEII